MDHRRRGGERSSEVEGGAVSGDSPSSHFVKNSWRREAEERKREQERMKEVAMSLLGITSRKFVSPCVGALTLSFVLLFRGGAVIHRNNFSVPLRSGTRYTLWCGLPLPPGGRVVGSALCVILLNRESGEVGRFHIMCSYKR